MSGFLHCDSCGRSAPLLDDDMLEGELADWLKVDPGGEIPWHHFCSRQCCATWAGASLIVDADLDRAVKQLTKRKKRRK